MDYTEKIQLKKDVRFLIGKKKSLICNMDNAESLFLSNECKDIIESAISENLNFNELVAAIEDESSKKYMCRVVDKLDELGMWSYGGNEIIDSTKINLSFDITNNCNLRCRHCCVNAGEKGSKVDLFTDEILEVIQKIITLNPMRITISGGEPLIRKDFCTIVEYLRSDYNGFLILMTNATLIDSNMAEFIEKNFDAVDISIDGANEESCSHLRGKGTFQKCIAGILRLKNAGMKSLSASMVLTDKNRNVKQDFYELCKKLEITPMVRVLDDSGRAKEMYKGMRKEMQEEINDKQIEEHFIKNKIYRIRPQIFACQGAKREFQIDYKGDIFPCGALMDDAFSLGNILKIKDIKKYLEERKFENTDGYRYFKSFFPNRVEKCKDCNKNLLCFSCVNELRRLVERGEIQKLCRENQCYYDLYWREYENI